MSSLSRIVVAGLAAGVVLAAYTYRPRGGKQIDKSGDARVFQEIVEKYSEEVRHSTSRANAVLLTSDELNRYVQWSQGRSKLFVVTNELNPVTREFEESRRAHGVSYELVSVASRTADEFFVAGKNYADQTVIELWKIPKVKGGYYSTRPTPGTGIGIPAQSGQTTIELDGTYLPMNQRRPPASERTLLYTGSAIAHPDLLAADPEGRFVLIFSGATGQLWQLPTQPGATPTLLYDTSSLPHLANRELDELQPVQHATGGRKYFLREANGLADDLHTLLSDTNNDGVFEQVDTLSTTDYEAAYPVSVWVDTFTLLL